MVFIEQAPSSCYQESDAIGVNKNLTSTLEVAQPLTDPLLSWEKASTALNVFTTSTINSPQNQVN